jgi:hypothetical protein
MEPRQQPECGVPARRVLDEPADERLVREVTKELGVDRRPPLRLRGLVEEDLAPATQDASAALARSAILPNAAGSLTARSASTFRSSSMFAFLHPETNWLYESP